MELEELNRLCFLAKIGLPPGQEEQVLARQNQLLNLASPILTQAATPLPLCGGVHFNDLRKDQAAPCLSLAEALQNATDPRDGCFTVPKMME